VEGRRLAQHHRLRAIAAEVEDHALAGEDSLLGTTRAVVTPPSRAFATSATLTRSRARAWERERRRGRPPGRCCRGGPGRWRQADPGERVDEAGGHDEARAVEDAGAGRRRDVRPHRLHETVAQDDRGPFEGGAGHGQDARADDRVGVGLLGWAAAAGRVRRRRGGTVVSSDLRERPSGRPESIPAQGRAWGSAPWRNATAAREA